MRLSATDGENAFLAFGLPGTPGTDEFWAAAGTPASVPMRRRRMDDLVPVARLSGEHRLRELVGAGPPAPVG